MRVLLTTDTAGGVWSHTMELAVGLERLGVAVTIATLGDLPSRIQRDDAELRGLPLRSRRSRLPWMPDPWDDVAATGRWLLALAGETRADVVHLSEPAYASLPWPIPVVAVCHSCVTSWWEAVHGAAPPAEWDRYREAMRMGLTAAEIVIAPSRAMVSSLERHYGIEHAIAIPNGMDPAGLEPRDKGPCVLTAGRLWDPAKNAATLDRAAAGLRWPVYAAGPLRGPAGEAIELSCLKPLGLLSSRQLGDWMSRAAVFALPALYEPFGLSVLEAAFAGCALVLGEIPSLRENWDGAALFVPPRDSDVLRLALIALLENPTLRDALAFRASRRALAYSARRMAVAYHAVYSQSLGRREVSACAS